MNAMIDDGFKPFPVDVDKIIEPDQVMPLLLQACPSFKSVWDAFLQQSETRLGVNESTNSFAAGAAARE